MHAHAHTHAFAHAEAKLKAHASHADDSAHSQMHAHINAPQGRTRMRTNGPCGRLTCAHAPPPRR
eukprot:6174698-Pleurochrysis_carterae.AAC.2